jgi:hypothetical protein
VRSRLYSDDVRIGAGGTAVVRPYPVIVRRIGPQRGNTVVGHVADVQILIAAHIGAEGTVGGNIEQIAGRPADNRPVRGETAGSHISRRLRSRST